MNEAPGSTFTAVAVGAAGGLAGTIGVRIERADGTTHTARVTTGIVEVEPDSGIYAKADLVAPSGRGTYLVLWDDGDSLFAAEELRVSYGAPAAPSGDFITVDELAAYLSPRAPRDLSDDLLAALACVSACARLRTETGQELDAVDDDTVTFAIFEPVTELLLPEMPVREVDEVRVDGEVSLDWHVTEAGVLVSTEGAFSRDSAVEVDYSHGFEPVPADLRLLALTLAARVYQQGISRQESTGGSSVTWSVPSSLDLSAGEKGLVAKYRHRRASTVAGAPAVS